MTESTIPIFQLMQWKYALQLEMKGMKHSKGSVYAQVKKTLGFSGSKLKVYQQLVEFIEDAKENAPIIPPTEAT